MKLIADSGSTNCPWVVASEGKRINTITTEGINPFYQTEQQIVDIICNDLLPHIEDDKIQEIYFYSAGCAFPEKIAMVRNALEAHFQSATIEINTDLLAAARASCGKEDGVACILGTGSNSCLYDGQKIVKNVSPLGFILGDEGSGATICKIFMGNLLKNQYATSLHDEFLAYYHTSPQEIMENIYRKPFPNRYLAQFTRFIAEHINEPMMYDLVFNAFIGFITRNVMQYEYKSYPVYFTGSVAWYFADVLRDACLASGILPADIQQSPMDGLIHFHQ